MPIIAAGGVDAGLLQDFEQAKQRGRRVADHHHRSRQLLRATIPSPPRVRVVPSLAASAGTVGSDSVQITALSAGSRARVMPCATIWASQKIGAPARSACDAAALKPVGEHDVVGDFDHAAGVDDPYRDLFIAGLETVEPCLGADDRERAPVDRRTIGLVGVAHDAASASAGAAAIRSITLLRRVIQ